MKLTIIILIIMISSASAATIDSLSNKGEANVGILFPIERTYSLDNETWQEEPIEFENINGETKRVKIFIRTENHANRSFNMNILHSFSNEEGINMYDIRGPKYGVLRPWYKIYDEEKGRWTHQDSECKLGTVMIYPFWRSWEYDGPNTLMTSYRAHRGVNHIEAQTVRYEKIILKFGYCTPNGIFTYDSKVELVGGYV